MDQNLEMVSMTDLTSYHMPDGVFTGKTENIRSLTNDFLVIGSLHTSSNNTLKVWKVKEKKTNSVYAIKEISQKESDLRKDYKAPIRHFREINLLQSMNHENVIKLLHVYLDTESFNLLLVFDFCPHNLMTLLELYPAEKKVPIDQVKCITRQMFKGLNYIHKSQVVHRDIKLENLLISDGGQLKITDFDASRRMSHLNKPTTPTKTCFYQAPEILLEAITYDEKVDIWSAGCVLVEIITKMPLFNGKSDLEQLKLMTEVLGQATFKNMPKLSECRMVRKIEIPGTPYNKLTDKLLQLGCPAMLSDLLCNVIVWEPSKRLSAEQCILDDWFETAPFPSPKIEFPIASSRHLAIK